MNAIERFNAKGSFLARNKGNFCEFVSVDIVYLQRCNDYYSFEFRMFSVYFDWCRLMF